MPRILSIPKTELVSGIALVALCAATILQLLVVKSRFFDDATERPGYSNRETWPIIRLDSCDLERAADAFGVLAFVPDTRVSGWWSR